VQPADGADPKVVEEVERRVGRLAERLRTLSLARLAAPSAGYATRADAGRRAAGALADAALGVSEAAPAGPPRWREVPRLRDFAVGDQVAVTGRELVEALAAGPAPDAQVWTRTGRRRARDVVAEVLDLLAAVGRVL
jgi:hypothetical protein